jgi:two-component system, chemotaxis family, protein-glutamate methylesterase/glutaminase
MRETPPIRVLIVDDSAVVRRVLGDLLMSDPKITVVGAAANGIQALTKIPEVKPDLVTLDIEMPEMDGLQTLDEIRKLYPKLPVIMFSTLTERGATQTLDALARGASDYVTKPSGREASERPNERVREELLQKIKSFCPVRAPRLLPLPLPSLLLSSATQQSRIDIVAIGSSTGGPNALTALIPELPADFPVPVVIVQHMPPLFTRLLAERLHGLGPLAVREGKDGQILLAGQVWIAPGEHHMTVVRKGSEFVLGINRDPQENSCRPAVDVLFRTTAQTFGANVLAVVLTGMGADGTRGAAAVKRAGGEVIVQDEESSVVWGMPGSVVAARLADRVYPLAQMGPELVRRVAVRRGLTAAVRAR